ncbi:ABC-type glycerol-3-phosphate transport system, substrate-binding protein [Microlunatus soli]|uniref:ABC-type glycerol-3-phosphate transport system, substrate-binding protein n=2 Tax=Microlunatus soli TaxID=630515 RepID=A0A1H1TWL9_9ACTN|nr:ABC-type glycerol-3-phosphate transport system, substrate-binding protein [Microlunatus soli]
MFPRLKRTRAVLAGATVLAVTAMTFAGCSPSTDSSTKDGGSATQGTLNWWSWTPDNDLAEREIAAFNKVYPDIKVTYKKINSDQLSAVLRPALASDDGPDVFTVNASGSHSAQAFAAYAEDLTPHIKKLLGDDWRSKVFAPGADAFTVKGRLVAAEWAKVGAGMMWINQDMFDKYGLKPPKNLAEWKTLCATFRSKGHGCFQEGFASTSNFGTDTLHSLVNNVDPNAWTNALSGKGKWNSPAFVKGLQNLRTLQAEGILDKGAVGVQQYPDVNNAFLSGKIPMVQMGTWYSQYATVNSMEAALEGAGVPKGTKKITIMPIPFPDVSGSGIPMTVYSDPDAGQAVNAKSKHLNAAITFALWLGNTPEGAHVVANNLDEFPTLKGEDVGPQWDKIKLVNPKVQQPALKAQTKLLEESTAPRNIGMSAEVGQAITDAAQAMVNSTKTPQQVADTIQAAADSGEGR